jgi:hypothetical protein
MVAQNLAPPQGGNTSHPHQGYASLSAIVFICNDKVSLTTRAKTYDTPLEKNSHENGGATHNLFVSTTPPPSGPLSIEIPISELVLRPPKRKIRKLIFNTSACVDKDYNIVEDLAHEPCTMLTLEVIQNCPCQSRTMMLAIGAIDLEALNIIMFNLEYFKMRLSHHLAFQVHKIVHGNNI